MTNKLWIVCFAFGLTACASQAPLDDAYYWPDKKAAAVSSSSAPAENAEPSGSPMEIISAQDTTITVRIRK